MRKRFVEPVKDGKLPNYMMGCSTAIFAANSTVGWQKGASVMIYITELVVGIQQKGAPIQQLVVGNGLSG